MPASAQICCIDAPWKPERTKQVLAASRMRWTCWSRRSARVSALPFERLGLRAPRKRSRVFHVDSAASQERMFILNLCE